MRDPGKVLAFGDYELDFERRALRRAGKLVEIRPTPLRVLMHLAEQRDRTVSRRELLDAVWPGVAVSDEALTTALKEARQAVGDAGADQRVIRTYKGVGYRFAAEVEGERERGGDGAGAGNDASSVAAAALTPKSVRPRQMSRGARLAMAAAVAGAVALGLWSRPSTPESVPFGIAVLPLASLSDLPADRALAEGLTEQITHALSQNGYPVVARTTAAQWRGRAADVRELGLRLGVSHVLEGSVRRGGERVRVTMQLVASDTGLHVWSETFEPDSGDPLATEDLITERVAMQVYKFVWEDAVAMKRDRRLAEVAKLVVESRSAFLENRWEDQLAVSARLLALAPEREPYLGFRSQTHAMVSFGWANLYGTGRTPFAEAGPKLLEHAEAAAALAPEDPFARSAISRALGHHWRWEGAEREMRRTCELAPRSFDCGAIRAHVCASLGCVDEQLAGARMRLQSAPDDAHGSFLLLWALVNDNEIAEADAVAQRLSELGWSGIFLMLPLPTWRLGRQADAVTEMARALDAVERKSEARELERRGAISPEAAWRWLAEQEAGVSFAAAIPALNDFLSARTYAELGDFGASLSALERSVAEHEAGMELFGLDPIFDPIRDTPRFRALIEKMGLTAYHAKYSKRGAPLHP